MLTIHQNEFTVHSDSNPQGYWRVYSCADPETSALNPVKHMPTYIWKDVENRTAVLHIYIKGQIVLLLKGFLVDVVLIPNSYKDK